METKKLKPYIAVAKNLVVILFVFFTIIQCNKDDVDNPPLLTNDTINTIDTSNNELPADLSSSIDLLLDSCVLIPIGQLTKTGSAVNVYIDDSPVAYGILDDRLGGYWAIIPDSLFTKPTSVLNITITKRNTDLQLFDRTNDSTGAYLESSTYINWKSFDIISTARNLYDTNATNTENALTFQKFVIDYLTYDNTYSNRFGIFTAQQTFANKKGVCINYSRLFIALCRAVGIPARSVSGVVYNGGSVGQDCLGHHQWCEFLDENNQWRSLDLTFTHDVDITSVKYIGFTYCAEETELFADYFNEFNADLGKPFKTKNECLLIYCYLPTVPGAKFGFSLVNNSMPDSIIFKKIVSIEKTGKIINLK